MNKQLKKKWVEALLSGEYRQGYSYLREHQTYPATYCCLGVLREVATPGDQRKMPCSEYLSRQQLAEVGLTHEQQKCLANLNDECVPFDMIAGLIDQAL